MRCTFSGVNTGFGLLDVKGIVVDGDPMPVESFGGNWIGISEGKPANLRLRQPQHNCQADLKVGLNGDNYFSRMK
ncbi:MAG: hypothetical protein WAS49_04695 [Candidatus Dechloromonas phosphoritropha]|jgi:hypothetical protein|nr:hypothetical protein [Candidatus Dechloromonas phosphoritropha]MBP8786936.1 hypothetical protein [Azonexus sp.]MBP9227427.1 hypothetical protein [Azonexus sp.]